MFNRRNCHDRETKRLGIDHHRGRLRRWMRMRDRNGALNISIENHASDISPAIFILLGGHDERERILDHLGEHKAQAAFVFISGFDWNQNLSPWPAPAAWKGTPDFSGGANAFLDELTGEVLPEVRVELGYDPAWYGIAGYSLAGLFAVYSLYRTDVFRRAASASGSMWFDDFREYAVSHPFAGNHFQNPQERLAKGISWILRR